MKKLVLLGLILLLTLGLALTISCVSNGSGGGGGDDDNGDPAQEGEAQISDGTIYVPGAKLYYRGEEYSEKVSVPGGALVGAELNGEAYLIYNFGENRTFQLDETSARDNLILYILDYYDQLTGGSEITTSANDSGTTIDFGECGWWWDEYDHEFRSGVGMNDWGGGYYEFFNCKVRWSAVESMDQFIALSPKDVIPSLSDVIGMVLQELIPDIQMTSSLAVQNIVRTYGAIDRMFFLPVPFNVIPLNGELFDSVQTAMDTNPDLFLRINAADFVYVLIKMLHEVIGLVPFEECLDAAVVNEILDAIETFMLDGLLGEEAAKAGFKDTTANLVKNVGLCVAGLIPHSAVALKIIKLVFALGTLTEQMYIGGFDASTSLAYDDLVLDDFRFRFTLTWGETPRDLDSHLWTPDGYHVYFSDKGSKTSSPYCELDVDDTTSYGPENLTIYQMTPGTYYYAVYNYSDEALMPGCGARVVLQNGDGDIIKTLDVPAGSSDYRWWIVARINGDSGQVNIVDELSNDPPAE